MQSSVRQVRSVCSSTTARAGRWSSVSDSVAVRITPALCRNGAVNASGCYAGRNYHDHPLPKRDGTSLMFAGIAGGYDAVAICSGGCNALGLTCRVAGVPTSAVFSASAKSLALSTSV